MGVISRIRPETTGQSRMTRDHGESVFAGHTAWSEWVWEGAPGQVRTASARTRTRRELLVFTTVEIPRRRRGQGGEAR